MQEQRMRGERGVSILSSILIFAITGGLSLASDFGAIRSETQLTHTGSAARPVDSQLAAASSAELVDLASGPGEDIKRFEQPPPDYRFPLYTDPVGIFRRLDGDITSLSQKLLDSIPDWSGSDTQPPPQLQTCTPQQFCQDYTVYGRNSQCTDTPVQTCPYGCAGNACAPTPQQAELCPPSPQQPDPSACSGGSWRPTYNGACVANWQCVSGSIEDPLVADLSCEPKIADVGMSLAISYACSLGTSIGSGFATNGVRSGSTTIMLSGPPDNTNIATYGLTCITQDRSVQKECGVQIGKPSIVFVAGPERVGNGEATALGWVTSGMQSCVVSSPDVNAFTLEHAAKTNVNGITSAPQLTANTGFLLHCRTFGGGVRDATITVSVK